MRLPGSLHKDRGSHWVALTLILAAVTLLAASAGSYADANPPECETQCNDSCPDCDDCVCCLPPILMIPNPGLDLGPADPEPGLVPLSVLHKNESTHIQNIDHPPRILHES